MLSLRPPPETQADFAPQDFYDVCNNCPPIGAVDSHVDGRPFLLIPSNETTSKAADTTYKWRCTQIKAVERMAIMPSGAKKATCSAQMLSPSLKIGEECREPLQVQFGRDAAGPICRNKAKAVRAGRSDVKETIPNPGISISHPTCATEVPIPKQDNIHMARLHLSELRSSSVGVRQHCIEKPESFAYITLRGCRSSCGTSRDTRNDQPRPMRRSTEH